MLSTGTAHLGVKMKLPRLSTFPLDKPFELQDPTTALSEIALRLVVGFYTDAPVIVGTATVLTGHCAVPQIMTLTH